MVKFAVEECHYGGHVRSKLTITVDECFAYSVDIAAASTITTTTSTTTTTNNNS
jgi:hypothetical protein